MFDMDGLLLDSEQLALVLFCRACEGQGIEPDLSAYRRCIGTTYARTREILMQAHGPSFPYQAVADDWSRRYETHVLHTPIRRKPGARNLLQYLEKQSTPVAVATQTRIRLAQRKLELAGLARYIQQVVGGDQVTRGKPHPEPYLTAATRLKVDPAHCWALEDSNNGVQAAHAAGMNVIHIPDLVAPSQAVRTLQFPTLNSLQEVIPLLEVLPA